MKLIVTGATGYVGSELIRQSLRVPEITSVIALARKPVQVPDKLEEGSDPSKLKSVVIEDYGKYPDEVKKEFEDADACIWTVAITPTKSSGYSWDYVTYVCQQCPLAGMKAMHESTASRPFRFLYISGAGSERDQTKTPKYQAKYSLMRGATETKVLEYAAQHPGEVEAMIARPAFITGPLWRNIVIYMATLIIPMPKVSLVDLSKTLVHHAVHGSKKDTLEGDDLDGTVSS